MNPSGAAVQPVHPDLSLALTADQYRLLADLLLDHIGTDPVRNDALGYLVQSLFVLAVRADQTSGSDAAD